MATFLLKYKLVQEFEVEVEADTVEEAKQNATNESRGGMDFTLAACERAGDVDFETDFEFVSAEEVSNG